MDITVSQEQARVPVTVLRVKGDISAATYEQLIAQARKAHENGARDILVDLADVPYMSSSGIRALNDIFNMLRTSSPAESDEAMRKGIAAGTFKSPHLKLLNPSKRVSEVLKMAGLDMFLEIHHDFKQAIASF